ncbi:MAG: PocR ligand-binding domain-containing protein, partial [Candidatus Odinarchaeota archaeon]
SRYMDNNFFKNLIEKAYDAYFLIDEYGNFLYSNKIANELVGYKKNELIKMSFKEILYPNNWKEMNEILKESKRKSKPKKFESFLIKKNNISIPIEINIQIIEWKGTNLYFITVRDITRYNTSTDKIKKNYNQMISPKFKLSIEDFGSLINKSELQRLLDDFYKLTKIGVGIMDMKGNLLAVSNWQDICIKFHRVHPLTSKNCTESDTYLIKRLRPGKYSLYKCKNNMWDMATPIIVGKKHVGTLFIGQFFFKEEEIEYEFFIKQAEKYGFNKKLYLDALNKVPRWSKEKIHNAMEFLTKFASMISELIYNNLVLNNLLQEKELFLKEILKSSQFKTQFLATMSHELRTPLNAIIGFTDLLLEDLLGPITEVQREYIKDIKSSADYQFEMIQKILDISQIESGQISLDLKYFSLKSIIDQIISNFKLMLDKKKIEMIVVGLENDFDIYADPIRFKEIIFNLISNAIKYTIKGEIRLIIEENSKYWIFKVKDTGIGIDEKDFDIIFEEFKRVDSPYVLSVPGTGLGLSLIKRLIILHGGNIEFESKIGVGSTFSFRIPKI